ncbi:hypothetical protein TWF281_002839 [Arthrobotrys megalospora]
MILPRGAHIVKDPNKITKTQIILVCSLAGGIVLLFIALFAAIRISDLITRRKWEAIRRREQTQARLQLSAATATTDCVIEAETGCKKECEGEGEGGVKDEEHEKDLECGNFFEKEEVIVIVVEELKERL